MLSTDATALREGSATRERFREYNALSDTLSIIVLTTDRQSLPRGALAPRVTLYATRSWNRPLALLDAGIIAWRLIRSGDSSQTVLTAQDPFELGLLGLIIARCLGIYLQVQIHTDFASPFFKNESLRNRLRTFLAQRVIPRADGVRVVSERIAAAVRDIALWQRVVVLPIYVPLSPREPKQTSTDKLTILAVSRLTKEKDIATALKALRDVLAQFPNVTFRIVGEGPEHTALENEARNLGIEKSVVFEGHTDDVAPYYQSADVFLLTSRYEGYGRVLIEAAYANLPIIMTNVGIAGDILLDEKHALVCTVSSPQCIASKLERLIADPLLRGRLGTAAREAVESARISKEEYLMRYRESLKMCMMKSL